MKRDEALGRLAALQKKMQEGGVAAIPADKVASMFTEFIDVVKALSEPVASPAARRMQFAANGIGDKHYKIMEVLSQLSKDDQKAIDSAYICSKLLRRPASGLKSWNQHLEDSTELKKALETIDAGQGADWVPTQFSPELLYEITQFAGVEQMHQHIAMPTNPYVWPLQVGRGVAYKVSEQTGDTGQTAGTKSSAVGITNKLTLSASGIQAEMLTSKNMEEDSIIAVMPFLREELVKTMARAIEEATINGDTTGTHQDSDVTGSDDRRKLWKGYRKHALANGYSVDMASGGNGFDFETFMKVRGKLGKYGVNPADLYWLVSLNTYFKALSLKNAGGFPVVVTADKFGADATIVRGQLGALAGSPLVVSEFSRDDLNASGAYDNVTKTLSSILCVFRPGFVYGDRRDLTMQVLGELYAEYQQDALLLTMRKDFQPFRPIATNAAVAIGYNIAA